MTKTLSKIFVYAIAEIKEIAGEYGNIPSGVVFRGGINIYDEILCPHNFTIQ